MEPYFSIILPVYNVEPYLERCVQSVLTQDFSDYEMILVDDGSTDRSGQLCDEIAARYDHVQVIHKANGGLSSARNAGTQAAKGRYIWWVDSDDWIRADALSVLYGATNEAQPDMVKFNYIRAEETLSDVCSCAAKGDYVTLAQIAHLTKLALMKTSKYILSAWSHIYRRDFLEMHKLSFVSEREIGSEDYLFNLQALLLVQHLRVIDEPLYFYEQRMGSLTQRYKKDAPGRYMALYQRLCACTKEKDMPLVHSFFVWHLIHGVCIPNEYGVTADHSLEAGRNNIREFLKWPTVQNAIKKMDRSMLSRKQKMQLLAMKWRIEPVFYWLYVVKPGRKRGV